VRKKEKKEHYYSDISVVPCGCKSCNYCGCRHYHVHTPIKNSAVWIRSKNKVKRNEKIV